MATSDNPDKEVMRNRIADTLSRLLSEQYDAKIKITIKDKEEEKKDKK